jgi:hypothetical protein
VGHGVHSWGGLFKAPGMRALRIKLILRQYRSVLTGFQLSTVILQRFFCVFQDVIGVLAIAMIDREVGRGILRLGGTTGLYDEAFPMFDGHSKAHGNSLIVGLQAGPTG